MASNSAKGFPSIPSLLDRLSVGEPHSDSLLRDLSALLNATALAATRDLSDWPQVSRSVLNYGIAGFTGRMLTNADIPTLQRNIARAIQTFEPRLVPKTVQVEVFADVPGQSPSQWQVRITAKRRQIADSESLEYWAVVDAESGTLQFNDQSNGR